MSEEHSKQKFIVFQKPNTPLSLAILFWVGSIITSGDPLYFLFRHMFLVTLLLWAALEIIDGANLLRRLMGAAVVVYGLYAFAA